MPELKAVFGEVVSWRTALTYGRKTVNGRVIGTNWVYGEARIVNPEYGTRCSTVLLQSKQPRTRYAERSFSPDGSGSCACGAPLAPRDGHSL